MQFLLEPVKRTFETVPPLFNFNINMKSFFQFQRKKCILLIKKKETATKKNQNEQKLLGSGGIRTQASEETGVKLLLDGNK
jgi:hypothetical protein